MQRDFRTQVRSLVCTVIWVWALSAACWGQVVRVSPDGNGADGQSWATAFSSIGQALAALGGPGQVWIRDGVYPELLTFAYDGVELYGGFAGDEQVLADRHGGETVLDADQQGRPVSMNSVNDIVLDRLTIRNGRGFGFGGGLFLSQCENVRLADCVVESCTSGTGNAGGGMYVAGGSLTIVDSVIRNCVSLDTGGGVRAVGTDLTVDNVLFSGNSGLRGGAMGLEGGSGLVTRCDFTNNTASSLAAEGGGALYLRAVQQILFTRNYFRGNGALFGSAVDCSDRSTARFYNNLFVHNTAGTATLLIRGYLTWPRVINNTYCDNTSTIGNSVIYVMDQGNATFRNELICYNTGPMAAVGRDLTSGYSWAYANFYQNDVAPFTDPADLDAAGPTTTRYDSKFVNRLFLDDPWSYHLQPSSPILDYGQVEVVGDFVGGERPVNANGYPSAYPDKGCFEYQAVEQYVDMPLWEGPDEDGNQSYAKLFIEVWDGQGTQRMAEWVVQSPDGFYLLRGEQFSEGSGPFDVRIHAAGYLARRITIAALPAFFSTGVDLTLIPGDATGDNLVDTLDLNVVLRELAAQGVNPADLNGDLVVDLHDLNTVLTHFGETGD